MKKTLLTCILFASALMTNAQGRVSNTDLILDAAEDTTQVTTIADIVTLQERVSTQNTTAAHKQSVWGRKTYLNLSYMLKSSLTPEGNIPLGYKVNGSEFAQKYEADKAFALQIGHSYALHKKPIANVVQFNLDYTFIDISVAKYNKEPGEKLYDSSSKWEEKDDDNRWGSANEKQYIPWSLGKWDINYGMNLGPSIIIAPFTYLKNAPGLHYLKLKAYYHIGYQVGLMVLSGDKKADAAYEKNENQYQSDFQDNIKLNFDHGLTQSFGASLSWKAIGVGYETRWDKKSYKNVLPSIYGSETYKFKGSSSRVYIQFCY